MCASAFFASLETANFQFTKRGMWLRRSAYRGRLAPFLSMPALRARTWYFVNGLLAVPPERYLERGTRCFCDGRRLGPCAERGSPVARAVVTGRGADEKAIGRRACRSSTMRTRPSGNTWRTTSAREAGFPSRRPVSRSTPTGNCAGSLRASTSCASSSRRRPSWRSRRRRRPASSTFRAFPANAASAARSSRSGCATS